VSWKALTWASDQTCRTSAEKFVLIMLANHADEQNTCYPSVEKLAAETQLGASTVRRCITHLTIDGKIRVLQRWATRGSRRSNRYQLLLDGAEAKLPEHDDWQREYEYTPRPNEGADAGETIPLAASGMPDQGLNTARCEQTAQSERYIPPGASGYSNKEVVNLHKESPPTPQTAGAAEDLDEDTRTKIAACADDVQDQRPEWSRRRIVAAIREAMADGRDPQIVLEAARLVAADPLTRVPGRLNEDGEWWAQAAQKVRASVPKPPPPRWCDQHAVKLPHGVECRLCAEDAPNGAPGRSEGAAGASEVDPDVAALRAAARERLARAGRL
jgi:hypothetical protein